MFHYYLIIVAFLILPTLFTHSVTEDASNLDQSYPIGRVSMQASAPAFINTPETSTSLSTAISDTFDDLSIEL
jgi:hypothetical protein